MLARTKVPFLKAFPSIEFQHLLGPPPLGVAQSSCACLVLTQLELDQRRSYVTSPLFEPSWQVTTGWYWLKSGTCSCFAQLQSSYWIGIVKKQKSSVPPWLEWICQLECSAFITFDSQRHNLVIVTLKSCLTRESHGWVERKKTTIFLWLVAQQWTTSPSFQVKSRDRFEVVQGQHARLRWGR